MTAEYVINQANTTPRNSFVVGRIGVTGQEDWAISLERRVAVITPPLPNKPFRISVQLAKKHISLTNNTKGKSNVTVMDNKGKKYQFELSAAQQQKLKNWLPKATIEEMESDLSSWGGTLIVIGFLHLILSGFLDPGWGVLLIILGIVTLLVKSRGMFIVLGLTLIVAGILNITAGVAGLWTLFGFLQLYWGVRELFKYGHYASAV